MLTIIVSNVDSGRWLSDEHNIRWAGIAQRCSEWLCRFRFAVIYCWNINGLDSFTRSKGDHSSHSSVVIRIYVQMKFNSDMELLVPAEVMHQWCLTDNEM